MKRSIIGLFIAIPMLSFGQSNYQKGYVLKIAADTLRGFIDYKPKVKALAAINFRQEINSQAQVFTPETIKGYGIDGLNSFESYNVRISKGSTKTEGLKIGIDTSSRRATVFLKVLQSGPNVTIYSFIDEIKERFYIKGSSNTEPYELIKTRYIEADNSNKIVGADRYKGQLLFEMRSYNAGTEFFESDFDDLAYSEDEMIKIAAVINRMKVRVGKKTSRLFVGAGVGGSSVKYTGQNALANDGAVSKTSYGPSVNVGIDLAAKTLDERLNFRAELSVFFGKDTKVTNGQYIHSFDHTTFYLSPKVLYNLYNTSKLKFYVGLGAGGSYSSYSNNLSGKTVSVAMSPDEFDEIKVDLKPTAVSYNLNAGLVFKKIELTAMYTPHYKVSDYAGFNILMGLMHVGIKYRFD